MQQAHLHLIKYALAQGHNVSVFDGEEWDVEHSTKYTDIKECSECADDATLEVFNTKGESLGAAFVILSDEPEESIVDYTVTDFMNSWDSAYEATR
jgi:hypothetical protein